MPTTEKPRGERRLTFIQKMTVFLTTLKTPQIIFCSGREDSDRSNGLPDGFNSLDNEGVDVGF